MIRNQHRGRAALAEPVGRPAHVLADQEDVERTAGFRYNLVRESNRRKGRLLQLAFVEFSQD
jgi:hypothetical protein